MRERPKDLYENYIKCTVSATTEKAYKCWPINSKNAFYKWVSKSICYVDENKNVYAPKWAIFKF